MTNKKEEWLDVKKQALTQYNGFKAQFNMISQIKKMAGDEPTITLLHDTLQNYVEKYQNLEHTADEDLPQLLTTYAEDVLLINLKIIKPALNSLPDDALMKTKNDLIKSQEPLYKKSKQRLQSGEDLSETLRSVLKGIVYSSEGLQNAQNNDEFITAMDDVIAVLENYVDLIQSSKTDNAPTIQP